MSADMIPIYRKKNRESDERLMKKSIKGQTDAIERAAQIAADSFDKATQIQNEQFEKVFDIVRPEIEARQRVMKDIESEISGPFKETETGKFETKLLERGLAKRGLQKSGIAIEGVKDLAAREAERNLSRKFSFAGLTGASQGAGINSLTNLGNTLSSFAMGSGQAQAQGIQNAAFARSQGLMNMFNMRRQDRANANAQASATGLGVASMFMGGWGSKGGGGSGGGGGGTAYA